MSRRKGATFAGWAVAPHRILDPVNQSLGEKLRTQQIEPKMRPSIGLASGLVRCEHITADHVHSKRHADLRVRRADDLAGLEEAPGVCRVLEPLLHVIVERMGERHDRPADAQDYP